MFISPMISCLICVYMRLYLLGAVIHSDLFLFQEDSLNRCSISADSRIENSGSEDSSVDESVLMKENGYHDAEDEVDPEMDDAAERVLSGKLSESSGYAGSDLYDYKVPSIPLNIRNSIISVDDFSYVMKFSRS